MHALCTWYWLETRNQRTCYFSGIVPLNRKVLTKAEHDKQRNNNCHPLYGHIPQQLPSCKSFATIKGFGWTTSAFFPPILMESLCQRQQWSFSATERRSLDKALNSSGRSGLHSTGPERRLHKQMTSFTSVAMYRTLGVLAVLTCRPTQIFIEQVVLWCRPEGCLGYCATMDLKMEQIAMIIHSTSQII